MESYRPFSSVAATDCIREDLQDPGLSAHAHLTTTASQSAGAHMDLIVLLKEVESSLEDADMAFDPELRENQSGKRFLRNAGGLLTMAIVSYLLGCEAR